MIVVAIIRLATSIEIEAKALAADLQILPYEARLKLNAGVPTIALATPDAARATALTTSLQARGHQVLRLDTERVVAASTMYAVRRCRFEPDALVADDRRLAWPDLAAIVRATHRSSSESVDDIKTSKFSVGRAMLSGGLVTRKTTTSKQVTRVDEVDPVLYLFSRSGAPWILRERTLRYDALGADVTPTSAHNFARLIDEIRTRASGAAFDDRLVARRGSPDEIDLLAHVVASTAMVGTSPFR